MDDQTPTPPVRSQVSSRLHEDHSQDRFLGTLVGDRYRLVKRIGRGGMGVVYRAQDLKLGGRACAIKLLRRDTDYAFDRERFVREIDLVSRLDSPHIVNVIDMGRLFDGSPFVVMELLRGRNLAQLLKIHGPLSPNQTTKIALGVLAGLEVAHRQGVVHRDIKPGNVFVCKGRYGETTTKILDFGVATDINSEQAALEDPRHAYGTAVYMAPEQFSSQRCDGRTDLYGVGLLMYRMLSGRNPFSSKDPVPEALKDKKEVNRLAWLHLNATPAPLDVDPHLTAIIGRLMARDPADRFSTAAEAIDALELWLRAPTTINEEPSQVEVPSSTLMDFVGENSAVQAPASRRLKAMAGPLLLAASIIALSLTFPESNRRENHKHGTRSICQHTLASDPVGATVYHGDTRLGLTPLVVERPCQEVWLLSIRHPLMKEFPLKLRGRVHNELGTVKMKPAVVSDGQKDDRPQKERLNSEEQSIDESENDIFQGADGEPVPTGHAGVFKGI